MLFCVLLMSLSCASNASRCPQLVFVGGLVRDHILILMCLYNDCVVSLFYKLLFPLFPTLNSPIFPQLYTPISSDFFELLGVNDQAKTGRVS